MTHILLTGRQPELSIAELESLYGNDALTRLGDHALVEADVDFTRLGGSIKMATLLTTLDTVHPQKVFDYCRKALPEYLKELPSEGKIKLGVSLYGLTTTLAKQNANVLSLKKVIKQSGHSVRAVPNTESALTSAQTYHNALTSPLGLELVCVAHEGKTYIGRVTHVQDIDSYTLRDRGRPKRDPFVGMLPPKLAQTIISLATGRVESQESGVRSQEKAQNSQTSPVAPLDSPLAHGSKSVVQRAKASETLPVKDGEREGAGSENISPTILDPFCGTGVILQEALLMGYEVYGTDISEKMVRFSRDNINWAIESFHVHGDRQFEVADATSHTWRQPINAVACEGYLGQPLGGQNPTTEKLAEIMHDCRQVTRGFLKNIAPQLPPGTPLCMAVPAWYVDGRLHEMDLTDDIARLGFSWQTFRHVDTTRLFYSREDQVTRRHLLVLLKNTS